MQKVEVWRYTTVIMAIITTMKTKEEEKNEIFIAQVTPL